MTLDAATYYQQVPQCIFRNAQALLSGMLLPSRKLGSDCRICRLRECWSPSNSGDLYFHMIRPTSMSAMSLTTGGDA